MASSRVQNLERWKARCAAIPAAAKAEIQAALQANGDQFGQLLHQNVPKDAGALEGTIDVQATADKELSVTVSIGGPEAPYAAAVEFGHLDHETHVPPRPYFFPALRVIKKRLRARMLRAIRTALANVAGSSDE